MEKNSKNKDSKYKSYIQLLTANQGRIIGFVSTMVPCYSAAEDIMQETSLLMWERFDDFQEGTNFSAWGIAIARNLIRRHFRKTKRQAFTFDNDALDNLMEQADVFMFQDEYFDALRDCTRGLQERDRRLLKLRYAENVRVKEIAEKINLSTSVIYRVLTRIHYLLLKCVRRHINAWESA